MPIYEYRCSECGHELEKIQKISDLPLKDCPACGKPALQKLISAAGFRLKGGKKKNVAESGSKSDTSPGCGSGTCSACSD